MKSTESYSIYSAIIGAILSVCPALAKDCEETKSVTEFGRHVSYGTSRHGTAPVPTPIRIPGAARANSRYLRPQIKVTGSPWNLTIRDEAFRPIQTLTDKDLQSDIPHWTSRVYGNIAWLDFSAPQNVLLSVPKFLVMPDESEHTFYSRADPTNSKIRLLYDTLPNNSGNEEKELRRLGDSVAILVLTYGETSWCCTGVMVAPNLLLTNWHCGGPNKNIAWKDPQIWKNMIIDLSWDGDDKSREYDAIGEPILNELLDFALIPVAPRESNDSIRVPPLSSVDIGKVQGTITVIHHPACASKSVTKTCNITNPSYPGWRNSNISFDFTHNCDTERGSSGAPIFNQKGEIIGLQHLGFTYDNECRMTDSENKAVKMSAILEALPIEIRARLNISDPETPSLDSKEASNR